MNQARFLGLFLDEARQHLDQAYEQLAHFEARPQQPETLHALMRHFHSLKGMAATMGFEPFVELAHRMEGVLRGLERRPRMWSSELAPLFGAGLDRLRAWTECIARGETPTRTAQAQALIARLDTQLDEIPVPRTATVVRPRRKPPTLWFVRLVLQLSTTSPTQRIVATLARLAALGRVVRVRPPQLPLDDGTATMELRLELASTRRAPSLRKRLLQIPGISAAELSEMGRPARRSETPEPPTVWTRVPADALDWIAETLRALALERSRAADADPRRTADHSGFLIRRLFHRVEELRAVPFMSLSHRLEPAVQDAARREGKLVRLRVRGGELGLDRDLVERLVGPLRHLVRNAVAHGIESAGEREAAGKPAEGRVELEVLRNADRMVVSLTDDGRGMDPAAIRQAAVAAGELDAADARSLSHSELLHLALRPGVTTRSSVDGVAGRGSGLDAVARDLAGLGAAFELTSTAGEGTRFEFELPLRQALVQSIVFSRDGRLFGIPLRSVRRATSACVLPADIHIVDLGDGPTDASDDGYLLILDEPQRTVALIADEIVGRRELWLQQTSRPLSEATYVHGAALIENGALAMMIDPKRLVEHPW